MSKKLQCFPITQASCFLEQVLKSSWSQSLRGFWESVHIFWSGAAGQDQLSSPAIWDFSCQAARYNLGPRRGTEVDSFIKEALTVLLRCIERAVTSRTFSNSPISR